MRASGGGRRGGARALTPLVGREEELDLLSRRWERAHSGEGQLALVVGEPGIGKSRLIEEFRVRLGETPHTWIKWSSSQLLQNTPLHPFAEWGRLRFGGADAPDRRPLADLENTLALIGLDAAEYAPLLAPLVDVPLPKDRRAKLAPEELRHRQLAALTACVLAGARSQPVVLSFEDLHWADPTSLDLMQAFAERGAQAPLFVVATMRPEFRRPWSVRSHHSVIALPPLDRAQVVRVVGELASRRALPRGVVEGVSERTGGVPLFVEEVTRLLLERGVQGGAQAIPPTLQPRQWRLRRGLRPFSWVSALSRPSAFPTPEPRRRTVTIAAWLICCARCKDPFHFMILDHVDVDRCDRSRGGPFQTSGQARHRLDCGANFEFRGLVNDCVDQALAKQRAAVGGQLVGDEDDVLAA